MFCRIRCKNFGCGVRTSNYKFSFGVVHQSICGEIQSRFVFTTTALFFLRQCSNNVIYTHRNTTHRQHRNRQKPQGTVLTHTQGTSSEVASPGSPWPERRQGSHGLLEQFHKKENYVTLTTFLTQTEVIKRKSFMSQNSTIS